MSPKEEMAPAPEASVDANGNHGSRGDVSFIAETCFDRSFVLREVQPNSTPLGTHSPLIASKVAD